MESEKQMRYGLLCYTLSRQDKGFNIGDYIQSTAAKQFLPQVDRYVNREEPAAGDDHEPCRIIFNGWFMHHPENWPPPPELDALLVAFHLVPQYADRLLTEAGLAYFRQHQPVGCRDRFTMEKLQAHGIDAYFSGCLTMTLGETYRWDGGSSGEVLVVDPGYQVPDWRSLFRGRKQFARAWRSGAIWHPLRKWARMRQILKLAGRAGSVRFLETRYPQYRYPTPESCMALADARLREYARAKLVVTSRIHCALPCLAIGTPVLFVDWGFSPEEHFRVDDQIRLFHRVTVDADGRLETSFDPQSLTDGTLRNPETFRPLVAPLVARCKEFIGRS